ncbi:hypothetical protein [Aporhodopirellula aestuarii]|uniref:Calcineurin-like phosphoesterase domain-containing protein n=1 Tax=Aporhodopirellula aestuarii TaxID=2950107 RepID=A0ABT0UDK2_9BACT|nr:hypothetical protein [Aporhodopirellula aestuarii]MCM2375124.1 hypothetical protein [Aporhodopirellula aestuarii]
MAKRYDIIGDIHVHAEELKALLSDMGYSRHGLGFRHPDRKVVFVGDSDAAGGQRGLHRP